MAVAGCSRRVLYMQFRAGTLLIVVPKRAYRNNRGERIFRKMLTWSAVPRSLTTMTWRSSFLAGRRFFRHGRYSTTQGDRSPRLETGSAEAQQACF